MGITVGVLKESFPGERRVAVVPLSLPALAKAGVQVMFERGAGADAGFPDAEYEQKSARAVTRDEVYAARPSAAGPHGGRQS